MMGNCHIGTVTVFRSGDGWVPYGVLKIVNVGN